ncbi:MAG: glycosyltransferase, partial [Paludibacteraceae bacterium]|nr:glycosyltransferase [Paludibacteraceae bacterium]
MRTIKSITLIADDYPAQGHIEYIFVQQLVHAIINMGVKVTVVAPQSIVHNIVRRKKPLLKFSREITEKGIAYEVYRPYKLSFGNRDLFGRIAQRFNRKVITSILKKIDSDVLYSHFWNNTLPIYEYAIKKGKKLFVACGEGDDALENMVNTISEDSKKRLASAVTGVISVSTENKRKCIDFGLSKKEDVSVFPNCVNTNIFHKSDMTNLKKQLGIKDDDF